MNTMKKNPFLCLVFWGRCKEQNSHSCRVRGRDEPPSAICGTHQFGVPPLCQALQQIRAMLTPALAGREGGPGAVEGRRESPALPWIPALPAPPVPACSVAKCLGAKTVAARALECAQEFEVFSEVVDDVEAVSAVQRFLGE